MQPVQKATAGAVLLVAAMLAPGTSVSAAAATPPESTPRECTAREPGGPLWITADCVDPLYDQPVIDSQDDLTTPVPHHRVSGHFQGTGHRFTFAFPPRDRWDGRFHQLVYPLQDEHPADETVSFAAASGAYTVQTNGGGGYRVDAAAAKFSRSVAATYYREPRRRIYGYIYGASGGSYQTIAAIENTRRVWDGAVPMVIGIPTSIPNNFTVRALARLVLQDKAPQMADAVAPGGSGDPYAGLDDLERATLTEVARMGVPLRAWEDPAYVLGLGDPQGLLGLGSLVRAIDPTYVDDFWTAPGYLGTEQSPLGDLVRAAKIDHLATITQVNRDTHNAPTSLVLDRLPANLAATGLDYIAYDRDGTTRLGALTGSLDPATHVVTIDSGNTAEVLGAIDTGDQLRIDNRWFVALHAYHRHLVPAAAGFTPWDQFRDPNGDPIYPQRPVEVGPAISGSVSGGGTHTGRINGKVIVIQNLIDSDAFPWGADWYRARAQQALGRRFDDNFRLWFNDNADHHPGPVTGGRTARLVPYDGIYQQALHDIAAWAEHGVTPPRSTRHDLTDSQVTLPANAAQRRGIQPVVHLTANGSTRIDITAGQPVTLTATIQTPPHAGTIVGAEWDHTGTGNFTTAPVGTTRRTVHLQATLTYDTPGTYIPALRATAQRRGDPATPFTRVHNIGRMRVVVH